MPSIEQYDWSRLKPTLPEPKQTKTDPDNLYWRYKKKTPPKSTSTEHGKVSSVFKCSKCDYNPSIRKDLDDHWLLEHSK